jgi:xanthine dehydrogenase/oxidase|tara:strand:+ start:8117 stop:8371 length:255 start_codon:yes stop_codon:yes gene_type:complete
VQSSKGIGEPPLFLGSTVFFALREAIRAARDMNGKENSGADGKMWNMDSPATAERLRLAVGDDLVERARTVRKEGERNFLVAVA